MITIIRTRDMQEKTFECTQLQALDRITKIKDTFKHYLYAFPKSKNQEKRKDNFVFAIRIPGATVGLIEVTKDFEIMDAEYYQGEYNLKIFDKKELEKCDEVLKSWIKKRVVIFQQTEEIESLFKED